MKHFIYNCDYCRHEDRNVILQIFILIIRFLLSAIDLYCRTLRYSLKYNCREEKWSMNIVFYKEAAVKFSTNVHYLLFTKP